jgi:NADH-quinone oxidoreductase subunit J
MSDYLPVGLLIGVVLVVQLCLVVGNWAIAGSAPAMRAAISPAPEDVHNTAALGQLIYTRYVLMFQLAGAILFVAMIGAIVLTLRHRTGVKRQNILEQIHRERHEAVELKDIKPGQGI